MFYEFGCFGTLHLLNVISLTRDDLSLSYGEDDAMAYDAETETYVSSNNDSSAADNSPNEFQDTNLETPKRRFVTLKF